MIVGDSSERRAKNKKKKKKNTNNTLKLFDFPKSDGLSRTLSEHQATELVGCTFESYFPVDCVQQVIWRALLSPSAFQFKQFCCCCFFPWKWRHAAFNIIKRTARSPHAAKSLCRTQSPFDATCEVCVNNISAVLSILCMLIRLIATIAKINSFSFANWNDQIHEEID